MKKMMKTTIHNVIILDKSGSMSSIARQAVDGVNETIASIKSMQEKNPEQDNDLTLVAFCGCELRVIYRAVPIGQVRPMSERDYRPCCMTPLYDAMGHTITEVHRRMQAEENAMASVTIITDVESVAYSLSIDNHLRFDKTSAGTRRMFGRFNESRQHYLEDVMPSMGCCDMSEDDKKKILKDRASSFFEE